MSDSSSTSLLKDLSDDPTGTTPVSPEKRKGTGVTFAFDRAIVRQILKLLTRSSSPVVEKMLSTIFDEWGVLHWEDLIIFTCDDVNEFLRVTSKLLR